MLTDPVDEVAQLGVGEVPTPFGDLLHPIEQGLFAAPEIVRRRVARGLRLRGGGGGLDLGRLFRLGLLGRPPGALVVGVGQPGEQRVRFDVDRRRSHCACLVSLSLDRRPVDFQAASEGLDGGEEALLESDDEEACCGLGATRCGGEARLPRRAVFVEEAGEDQLGSVVGETVDRNAHDFTLREAALDGADVLLETPHHDLLERLGPELHAAGEAVGVEQLQQRGKAVRVPVVGRRGEEQAMLEAAGEVADRPREPGLDAVAPAARGRCVVGLVDDEQASRQERTQPLAQGVGVGRVDQEVVRDEEPAVCPPGIHAEAALPAHPCQVRPVQDLEDQAEAFLELGLPLLDDGRRRGDDDGLRLATQQQLSRDEPGLDRLAETRVVRDEEADAGETQGLAQRLHLVGVDLDAGPERRLEEIRVCRCHAVPAQRVEEGGEVAGCVEPLGGQVLPALLLEDEPVDLVVPEDV